jgi:hypothetical protein
MLSINADDVVEDKRMFASCSLAQNSVTHASSARWASSVPRRPRRGLSWTCEDYSLITEMDDVESLRCVFSFGTASQMPFKSPLSRFVAEVRVHTAFTVFFLFKSSSIPRRSNEVQGDHMLSNYYSSQKLVHSYVLSARPPIQAPAIHVYHVLQPARGRPAHK